MTDLFKGDMFKRVMLHRENIYLNNIKYSSKNELASIQLKIRDNKKIMSKLEYTHYHSNELFKVFMIFIDSVLEIFERHDIKIYNQQTNVCNKLNEYSFSFKSFNNIEVDLTILEHYKFFINFKFSVKTIEIYPKHLNKFKAFNKAEVINILNNNIFFNKFNL